MQTWWQIGMQAVAAVVALACVAAFSRHWLRERGGRERIRRVAVIHWLPPTCKHAPGVLTCDKCGACDYEKTCRDAE